VWAETGTKLVKRSARAVQSGDDVLVLAAAEALHEKWRSTVPKAAVWLPFKGTEGAFNEWFDARFHETMVKGVSVHAVTGPLICVLVKSVTFPFFSNVLKFQ
jgi:hypothetical protein